MGPDEEETVYVDDYGVVWAPPWRPATDEMIERAATLIAQLAPALAELEDEERT